MKQKLQIYLENLMLFLTGVYLIWQFSTQTTFYLNVPPKFHLMMFGALAFTAAFRLLILGLTRKKVTVRFTGGIGMDFFCSFRF